MILLDATKKGVILANYCRAGEVETGNVGDGDQRRIFY